MHEVQGTAQSHQRRAEQLSAQLAARRQTTRQAPEIRGNRLRAQRPTVTWGEETLRKCWNVVILKGIENLNKSMDVCM